MCLLSEQRQLLIADSDILISNISKSTHWYCPLSEVDSVQVMFNLE